MLYLHMHPHVDLYNVHQLLQQGKSLNWEKLFQFIQYTVYNASLWKKKLLAECILDSKKR